MTQFDEFVGVASKMGKGRVAGVSRSIPVFVPEGNHQEALYDNSLDYLNNHYGFQIIDMRKQTYENAIANFPLKWPTLSDKWPSTEFEEQVAENGSKLVVACGNESHPRFWKYLSEESLLYTGSALPPSSQLSPKCIVIPDTACVVAIIKHDYFFDNFPLNYLGPVGTYNSNTVPFYL